MNQLRGDSRKLALLIEASEPLVGASAASDADPVARACARKSGVGKEIL